MKIRRIDYKYADMWVLAAWTLFTTAFVLYVDPRPYVSTFLYFVLPTFYLFLRHKLNAKKIVLGSLLTGIMIPLPFDFLSYFNKAWFVPQEQLLIPLRFFNLNPVDELVWFFVAALYVITFYESFVDDERVVRLSRRFFKSLCFWASIIGVVFLIFFLWPGLLKVSYPYLTLWALASCPPIFVLFYKRPQFAGKVLLAAVFFFFVSLNFELTAVHLGQWGFAGQYIGTVTLLGVTFPFEEFFYWILLYPATIISYYELFVDDGR